MATDPRERPRHSSPYPVSRLAPAMELVELAREIARADEMLNARTTAKLRVIADQVKALQAEARKILEEANRDTNLNHARCAFRKIPGKTYYLYRDAGGTTFFSLLSPGDWRGHPPDEYVGPFRLETDLSWSPAEQAARTEDGTELVRRLLEDRPAD